MYGFLAQTCPPEAPLQGEQCVCLDTTTQWDVIRQTCVTKKPPVLTMRRTGGRRGGGTALFIGLLFVAGAAAAILAANTEFAERLVTPCALTFSFAGSLAVQDLSVSSAAAG